MANNKLAKKNDERMTVREVAKAFDCNPETVKTYIRELWPDLMQNGRTTYLNKEQMSIMLEMIKHPVAAGSASNLQSRLVGVSTSESRALRIARLNAEIQKELEIEIAELKQREEQLAIELDKAKEWLTIKRVAAINGINWKSLNWRHLRDASEYMEMPVKKVFDANYGEVNAYHISVWKDCHPELKYVDEQKLLIGGE